ncbi:signal transduction histidine kinase [Microbacterium terrae]|uniref:ATP-binding protein n=1 Tax=Microbacterium terrae TaxID=69369 RepID=UPI001B43EC89|nr:ATP-binding protein [Microbacterium terrae]MBP1078180.1 signal transduction histidine kinase [Microbacterium terrae]GLJ97659.1 histidine kinase [Microbacterium terrae]
MSISDDSRAAVGEGAGGDHAAAARAAADARPGDGPPAQRPPLERPRACIVSGVSAGLAAHLGLPLGLVRALFVGTSFLWGAGALLYAWLWVFTPWADAGEGEDAPTRRAPVAWILTGVACASMLVTLAGVALFGANGVVFGPLTPWVQGVFVTTGLAAAAGVWATLVDRRDVARGPRHETTVRIAVTAVLAILLIAQLASLQSTGAAGFLLAFVPIVGLALVYSSTLIGKWRELTGERVRRIREEQRAEMAAHLHDSVLQTLALIQNRAGASTEVARIARAQERELRAWLYDGDAPADSDLPTDLRDYAAALELDYPVRIDVVSAGLPAERASGEVAAASREAMLNAARHAGGEVSVYIEGNAAAVDVYVRDRGPGFDLDAVPADRLGIRESIVGRMRRAGGTATVRRGASGGTEVHLRFATDANGAEGRRG